MALKPDTLKRKYELQKLRPAFFILLGCLFNLSVINIAAPQESCITSECHSIMGKTDFIHGTISPEQCTVCHLVGQNDSPPQNHDLSYEKLGSLLCFDCHQNLEQFIKANNAHAPVITGECNICHSPHQNENKFLLLQTPVSDLCFKCHDDQMIDLLYIHQPLIKGDCMICHNPHASPHSFFLVSERVKLCFDCHDDYKADFERNYVHQPVKESCGVCHDPHASEFNAHLRRDKEKLCLICHQEFVLKLNRSFKHTAITERGCSGCHSPHSSDFEKGLREEKKDLCFLCHDDMKKRIAASKYVHEPVKKGDCSACHDPHATDFAKHLIKDFPQIFYFSYDISHYAMCFGCHNNEVAGEEFTETLTDFRNGNRNLHFVHVNKEKGRSCKACHEIHAGNQEKHIAREVPFAGSDWMLPIKYTKTNTGGSCIVGCHKEMYYDRMNPANNEDNQTTEESSDKIKGDNQTL